MATIQPKGERIRQAVRWISSERVEDDTKAISMLIKQARAKLRELLERAAAMPEHIVMATAFWMRIRTL